MEPAALTTTWWSPATEFTIPIASAWDSVGAFWTSMIRSTSVAPLVGGLARPQNGMTSLDGVVGEQVGELGDDLAGIADQARDPTPCRRRAR